MASIIIKICGMTAHAKSRQMAVALGMVWLFLFSSFCLCVLHCHNHDHSDNHESVQIAMHSGAAIAKPALEFHIAMLKHCESKSRQCMQKCKTLEASVLPKTIKLSQNAGMGIINATEQYFSHSIFGLLKEIVRPPPQALPPCKLICLLRSMRC